jgi:hypothetical protein
MFDNYQDVRCTNKFNFNINAVSGTLRKSHPKSRMTIQELKDTNCLFDSEQPKKFIKKESKYNPDWIGRDHYTTTDTFKNIIVLQVMLIGDGKAIIEYVFDEDFLTEDDEGKVQHG